MVAGKEGTRSKFHVCRMSTGDSLEESKVISMNRTGIRDGRKMHPCDDNILEISQVVYRAPCRPTSPFRFPARMVSAETLLLLFIKVKDRIFWSTLVSELWRHEPHWKSQVLRCWEARMWGKKQDAKSCNPRGSWDINLIEILKPSVVSPVYLTYISII